MTSSQRCRLVLEQDMDPLGAIPAATTHLLFLISINLLLKDGEVAIVVARGEENVFALGDRDIEA